MGAAILVQAEGRSANPTLLRKRILSRSSIFSTGKNPPCITEDTRPVFPRAENRISTQPPLSRDGWGLLTFPGEGILLVGIG